MPILKVIQRSIAKFSLFGLVALLISVTAQAFGSSPSIMTCQAFDAFGQAASKPQSFSASARGSRSLQVTPDGIAYIRWRFYTSPVEVLLQRNPHYPWNIPFTTTELGRGEIALNVQGLVDGQFDLSAIQEGYKLVCKQEG